MSLGGIKKKKARAKRCVFVCRDITSAAQGWLDGSLENCAYVPIGPFDFLGVWGGDGVEIDAKKCNMELYLREIAPFWCGKKESDVHCALGQFSFAQPMWTCGDGFVSEPRVCMQSDLAQMVEPQMSLAWPPSDFQTRKSRCIGIYGFVKDGLTCLVAVKKASIWVGNIVLFEPPANRRVIQCLRLVSSFYANSVNVSTLLVPMINRTHHVSKRAVEFFCVNMTKSNEVTYPYIVGGVEQVINVHELYNQTLRKWKRECFDFFQRFGRVYVFSVTESNTGTLLVESTVGQLHGLYWAKTYGVIDQVHKCLSQLMHEMSELHGSNRRDILQFKSRGIKRPRKRLVSKRQNVDLPHVFPFPLTMHFESSHVIQMAAQIVDSINSEKDV